MSKRQINPEIVRQQIANLFHLYPELRDDEDLRLDSIEAQTEANELFSSLLALMIDADMKAVGLSAYEKRFKERRQRLEHKVEKLRELVFKIMQFAEIHKVELPEATLSVRSGAQQVLITDESKLPDDLCKIERSPKKAEIKEALKSGKEVPGAELSNGAPSLAIRMN